MGTEQHHVAVTCRDPARQNHAPTLQESHRLFDFFLRPRISIGRQVVDLLQKRCRSLAKRSMPHIAAEDWPVELFARRLLLCCCRSQLLHLAFSQTG
ncbi:hypothetical protein HRbin36_01482 [bacterium HR36]|nr:hypothetical protein HRbin36_01482 [bacterium HR36]